MKSVFLALGAGACVAEPWPGLVLLDPDALEAGIEIVDGEGKEMPVLPWEVFGEVVVEDGEGLRHTVPVAAGELVEIGVPGRHPWVRRSTIGVQVDPDYGVVTGSLASLADLAEQLDDVDVDLGDGTLTVEGPDAWIKLAWAAEPAGLWAASPSRWAGPTTGVEAAEGVGTVAETGTDSRTWKFGPGEWGSWWRGSGDPTRVVSVIPLGGVDGADRREHVGFYELDGREVALSLDGQVRPAEGSEVPVATWTLDVTGRPCGLIAGRALQVERVDVPEAP
jgi:hypothetical protein